MQIDSIKLLDISNLELAHLTPNLPAILQVRVAVLRDNVWTHIRTGKLPLPWAAGGRELARDTAAEVSPTRILFHAVSLLLPSLETLILIGDAVSLTKAW